MTATLAFVLSICAPLAAAVIAALRAGFVADGVDDLSARPEARDLRTW